MSRSVVRGWKLEAEPGRVHFEVLGDPVPKGSMQGFVAGGTRAVVTERRTSSSRHWQRLIADQAQRHALPTGPLDGPLFATVSFWLREPASAPKTLITLPDKKPDVDKLLRALLDPLRNVIIADDARVVDVYVRKRYSLRPRVSVWIWQPGPDDLESIEEAAAELGRVVNP